MNTEEVEVVVCKTNNTEQPTISDLHRAMSLTKLAGVSKNQIPPSYILLTVKEDDKVAVKIRGLPYQVRYEEIADFFRDHRYIEKSAILGVGADGRKNGFGSILFEDQETAQLAAKELDGNYIGERYVEISVISYGDYLRFNGP